MSIHALSQFTRRKNIRETERAKKKGDDGRGKKGKKGGHYVNFAFVSFAFLCPQRERNNKTRDVNNYIKRIFKIIDSIQQLGKFLN